MIDALSTIELARVWLALREAGSPDADDYRQALLARLKVEPSLEILDEVHGLFKDHDAESLEAELDAVGDATILAINRRLIEAINRIEAGAGPS